MNPRPLGSEPILFTTRQPPRPAMDMLKTPVYHLSWSREVDGPCCDGFANLCCWVATSVEILFLLNLRSLSLIRLKLQG